MSLPATIMRAAHNLAPRLSFPAAGSIGQALGRLAWALDGRHRKVALDNLAAAFPELPPSRRQRLARQAFAQAGRNAMEMLWSAALTGDTMASVGEVSGIDHLEAALEKGRGALLASGHFGNWELMGLMLGLAGKPLHVVARRLRDLEADEVLRSLRTRTGNHVLYKDEAVRGAIRALRSGGSVAVLIDQNTLRAWATFVPFFERLAATTKLLAQLHLRTGAPILPSFAVPHGDRYRFVIEPALDVAGDGPDAVNCITAAATARVERYVRRHPEAWLWIHDRWRTRPE